MRQETYRLYHRQLAAPANHRAQHLRAWTRILYACYVKYIALISTVSRVHLSIPRSLTSFLIPRCDIAYARFVCLFMGSAKVVRSRLRARVRVSRGVSRDIESLGHRDSLSDLSLPNFQIFFRSSRTNLRAMLH